MKRKVVVIGLGHLGAHVMEILAISGIANELVGIDYNKKKEWGNPGSGRYDALPWQTDSDPQRQL